MLKKSNAMKKIICAVCAMTLVSGTLAGCSGGSGKETNASSEDTASGSAVTASGVPKEHASFTVLVSNYQDTTSVMTGNVYKKLQEITNASINIEWAPAASYTDKFNVMMASNKLPEVVLVPDVKSAVFTDAVEGDQFWELDKYISSPEFPNFKNLNQTSVNNTKTNGKSYCLPRERILKRQMVVYRADWAKKAGLGAPDTIEKVYNMAKTFADGDFDGNGKKDTVGFGIGVSSDGGGSLMDCLRPFVAANGAYNFWGVNSGKITPMYDQKQYLDTMALLRKMYSEGVISPDFSIMQTTNVCTDLFDKEKTGMYCSTSIPGVSDPLVLQKKKENSSLKRSDIVGYTYLKDSGGKWRIPCESGFNGAFAFTKSAIKDEAKLKQILGVFNVINGKEGQVLVNDGIEGTDFKYNSDGTVTFIDPNLVKTDIGDMNQLGLSGNLYPTTYDDALGIQLAKDRKTYQASDLITDASIPLYSQEYSDNLSNLNKIIDTAQLKYIMGQESADQFNEDIKKWKSSGGDKAADEYTKSYQEQQSAGSK